MYGLMMMALTEKQQERVQMCENSWIRNIARMKRTNKRGMEELRVAVGVMGLFKKKPLGRWLKWEKGWQRKHMPREGRGKIRRGSPSLR